MELIREHLIYKNVPITICFGTLKPIEQYECIRLLLATRSTDVTICQHNSTNEHINQLLSVIAITLSPCSSQVVAVTT